MGGDDHNEDRRAWFIGLWGLQCIANGLFWGLILVYNPILSLYLTFTTIFAFFGLVFHFMGRLNPCNRSYTREEQNDLDRIWERA